MVVVFVVAPPVPVVVVGRVEPVPPYLVPVTPYFDVVVVGSVVEVVPRLAPAPRVTCPVTPPTLADNVTVFGLVSPEAPAL